MTRSFLVTVHSQWHTERLATNLRDRGIACQVQEFPDAETLGHMILNAAALHFAEKGIHAVDDPDRKRFLGQAVIEQIVKPKGKP